MPSHEDPSALTHCEAIGSIVRLGPNEISFASPTAGLEIFKTGKGFHKSEFYTVFLPNNTKDIFTEIRENVHAAKKRFVSPPYSLAVVKQQRKQLEEVMVNLLSDLNRAAADDQNKVFDLGNWIFHLTSDVRTCLNTPKTPLPLSMGHQ